MKKITLFFFLLIPALAAMSACNQSGYNFSGVIKGAANLQVSLEQAHFDRSTVAIGRASCDANGAFKINRKEAFQEGLYLMKIGAKNIYLMLDGKEKNIEINGNIADIERMNIEVKGSETMSCYANNVKELMGGKIRSADDAKAFVQKGCTPLMRAFLTAQVLGQNADSFLDDFKAAAAALESAMPGSKYAKDYSSMIAGIEKQMGGNIKLGQEAPEISLPDPNGKVRSLSDMRGKIVLLDFWASWCGPCRRANPHVVEMYKKYKSKGFEVFSVSLDRPNGKDAWMKAIADDGLLWDNHVSDLKYWDCEPAATYGVRGIPKTFLIGRDGKIVAIDPRQNLEAELLKVL